MTGEFMSSLRVSIACLAFVLGAVGPALAQQNDYGGYDIVGSVPSGKPAYADVRGWRVFALQAGGKFAYCFAERDRGDGSIVRLGWDKLQWQLAVPVKSRPDWEGTLQVDGAGSGQGYQNGGDTISGTAKAGWTIAWLGEAELDGLTKGSEAVLGVGKSDYDFSLAGVTAAKLKVQECVERSGRVAAAAPPEETEAPSEDGAVKFGAAGVWIVNELRDGSRTASCELYDSERTNLRFEIDSENSYIDFKDDGDMGSLGQRIPIAIGFGPGSSPEQSEVEIIEGRDGEKWARITQGRADGPGYVDDAFPNATQVSFSGENIILERDLFGSNKGFDILFRCIEKIQ